MAHTAIPVLRRERQEEAEFKASLSYMPPQMNMIPHPRALELWLVRDMKGS